MTLRLRLVVALLALATAGLTVFGVVTFSLYAHSQYQRLDDQIRGSVPQMTAVLLDDAARAALVDRLLPRATVITPNVPEARVLADSDAEPEDLARALQSARDHDDYRAIIVKALADRFAEAFAEWLHRRARREWYAPDEQLEVDSLLRERFRGIRPAFGYPACPDHSEKAKLFELLRARDVGLDLTESFAMTPAAAVSGIYLAHPDARYFAVGRIGRDQLDRGVAEFALVGGLGAAPELHGHRLQAVADAQQRQARIEDLLRRARRAGRRAADRRERARPAHRARSAARRPGRAARAGRDAAGRSARARRRW